MLADSAFLSVKAWGLMIIGWAMCLNVNEGLSPGTMAHCGHVSPLRGFSKGS